MILPPNRALQLWKLPEAEVVFQRAGMNLGSFTGKKPVGYIDLYRLKKSGSPTEKPLPQANINDWLQHHSASFGITRSGKSNGAGRLMEQIMLKGLRICVVDYKGEFTTLEQLRGVKVKVLAIAGRDGKADALEFAENSHSYILNIETITDDVYLGYLTDFFTELWELRRKEKMDADQFGRGIVPIKIFVDECQYFMPRIAPKAMPPDLVVVARNLKGIFRNISQQGVGLGLPLHLITQRPTYLDPFIRNQCDVLLLYRQKWENDIKVYLNVIPNGKADAGKLGNAIEEMPTGQCIYVGVDGACFDAPMRPKDAMDLSRTPGWEQHIQQLEAMKSVWQHDIDSEGAKENA